MLSQQNDFKKNIYQDVKEYFAQKNMSSKGNIKVHIKPFIFLTILAVSYTTLVFFSVNWWSCALSSLFLLFALGGMGFGFAHDACHGSFSKSKILNRLMGCGYDLIGGSSYVWSWKHNTLHHKSPNKALFDPDIQTAPLLRLSKEHALRSFHRYQQYYFLVMYMCIGIRWQLWQDFATYFKGELVGKKFPKPKGVELFIFWGGKLFFFFFAFILPSHFHPLYVVLSFYFIIMLALGLTLGLILQVAHSSEGVLEENEEVGDAAEFQIRSTSNYCPKNKFLTWYTGGLNYHIEHHLFPSISSTHYPALSEIVKAHCSKHNIRYKSYDSYLRAITAHYRYLKVLGRG